MIGNSAAPIGNAIPGWNILSANCKMTIEGGYAIRVVNKTGEVSVKGKICEAGKVVDNSMALAGIDDPDPCAIIYEAGIADGELMWIVVAGKVHVLYGTAVDRGTFARLPVTDDSVAGGLGVAEPLPVQPFATNKHFMEIGHPLETIGAPGLALTIIHFN